MVVPMFCKKLLLIMTLLQCAFSSEEVFIGKAYDRNGNHLFTEKYTVTKEQEEIKSVLTNYYTPDEKLSASLSSFFENKSFLPKVSYKSESHFLNYGTKFLDNSIELFKSTRKRPGATKILAMQDNMVAGHGFYFYILNEVESLLKGDKKTMVFLQPNNLTSYSFNLEAKEQTDNTNLVDVTLSLTNKILKALVPDIKLTIEKSTSRILSYEGVSGFFPCNSKAKTVTIKYDYEKSP